MPRPQIGDSVDVYIDTNAFVTTPCSAHTQIGHLGADAGQRNKALNSIRDVAVEFIAQNLSHGFYVFGFIIVEADFTNKFVKSCGRDLEERIESEALEDGMLVVSQGMGWAGQLRCTIIAVA